MDQTGGLQDSEAGSIEDAIISAVDAAADGVLIFGNDGLIAYANPACRHVFRSEPSDMIGSNIALMVHPDDVEITKASMRSFHGEGTKPRDPSTLRLLRGDGTYGTFDTNGNPFVCSDGRRLNMLMARPSELFRMLTEALDALTGVPDLEVILEMLPEMLRLRTNVACVSVVWRKESGDLEVFGDDLPPELTGATLGLDAASPFTLAWEGKELTGELDDLPDRPRAIAAARDLGSWWLRPIEGVEGRVHVLVSMWTGVRGHNEPELEQRTRTLTNIARVSLRFSQQQAQLLHDAQHDALTGLRNRRSYHRAISSGAADDPPVALLYIDLDGFKPVNDEHGHQAGDVLLIEVADRLVETCRSEDLVSRVGGDEFAVLCRDCDASTAVRIAERFLARLREPIDVGSASVEVRGSVGVATGAAEDGDELARRADTALYDAKHQGGDRVVIAAT